MFPKKVSLDIYYFDQGRENIISIWSTLKIYKKNIPNIFLTYAAIIFTKWLIVLKVIEDLKLTFMFIVY